MVHTLYCTDDRLYAHLFHCFQSASNTMLSFMYVLKRPDCMTSVSDKVNNTQIRRNYNMALLGISCREEAGQNNLLKYVKNLTT